MIAETLEAKRLKKILTEHSEAFKKTLRNAEDMKAVHQAQAKLNLIDEITTQFFAREKVPHEQTELRL
jgi:hypothetical protein